MATEITTQWKVALYDNTNDIAFGPVFDGGEAQDFLEWLQDKSEDASMPTFQHGNEVLLYRDDPRIYRDDELIRLVEIFREERENAN